jgi:hypothetical protein
MKKGGRYLLSPGFAHSFKLLPLYIKKRKAEADPNTHKNLFPYLRANSGGTREKLREGITAEGITAFDISAPRSYRSRRPQR